MGNKTRERQVCCKYEFDRLGKQKMEQVYDILFRKVKSDMKEKTKVTEKIYEVKEVEISSDIYAGII
ncbi:hypothetical protein ACFL4A_02220 [bacterium]